MSALTLSSRLNEIKSLLMVATAAAIPIRETDLGDPLDGIDLSEGIVHVLRSVREIVYDIEQGLDQKTLDIEVKAAGTE